MSKKLFFYYGTMNSSKTANMLMAVHNYQDRNSKIILVTPDLDTRINKSTISSRIGLSEKADIIIPIEDEQYSLFDVIKNENDKKKIDVVAIDECQFLSKKLIDQLRLVVDNLNINVMCYGLKTDFQSHLFEGSKRLLEIADDIREVKTICHFCGRKAILNLRFSDDGSAATEGKQVQIGGNDKYLPVCSKHYFKFINKSK